VYWVILRRPQFAFLLQALQIGPGHGHQLQDDRGGDVRHDAQRKNRQAPEVAAAEQVDDAQHRTLVLLKQLRQHAVLIPGVGRNAPKR
jgi:hypothetical protein